MPFIGRDWRSPGEAWVKTETLGWQRMKIIESQLYPLCHQNPACSWPPRSEFGQHMESHCRRHNDQNDRNSNELRGSLSSGCGSSNESSRGSSISPSPTSSPEKSMHHLYPITISSPYGQYSCCSHHIELSSPTSKTNSCECPNSDNDREQTDAQTISRSLSRDSLRDHGSLATSDKSRKMHYNINGAKDLSENSSSKSVKGFSILKESITSQYRTKIDHKDFDNQQSASADKTPVLIKDGSKLVVTKKLTDGEKGEKDLNSGGRNKPRLNQINQMAPCCCRNNGQVNNHNMCHQKESHARTAPHCRISVRTREVAMYNTISEAFYRLDFCNAIHDIRRFNYICKLLHLLITQNLTSLSGCATKILFTMLEQVAWEVSSNKRNIHVLKNLLNELRQMIQKYYCWGRPIGSKLLWQQHFDTIERISQIVDGIELSPPKNDGGSNQATFDNLPVEMIREILLRLNDYRDLMNSAQASPLMRTMLDGQYIWKQLCKYHFTEQQLKMATDNYTGPQPIKKPTERGVKYARTSSADGRTSFRNPVLKGGKSSKCISTTRQQLEQTSSRRGCRQKETTSDTDSASSASYVTNAIKIFDREGSPNVMVKGRLKKNGSKSAGENQTPSSSSSSGGQSLRIKSEQHQQDHSSDSVRNGHDVDWERVFHQLRKKFDLKEEYADCLLLCRHCRCLFWKSFGHPCINNHNAQVEDHRFRFDHPYSLENGFSNSAQNNCNCDRSNRQANLENSQEHQQQQETSRHQNASEQVQRRLSVAALSRNFDNRNLQGRSVDIENAPPDSNLSRNASSSQAASGQPLFSINLNAQLRERNGRLANLRVNGGSNNNNLPERRTAQNEELVPKHVAISPQAFLKFFSL